MFNLVIILCGSIINHVDSTDIPKSHVPILEELVSKYMNTTTAHQRSFVDLLFGEGVSTEDNLESLDVNHINHAMLKNIIETERNKHNNISEENYRRQFKPTPAQVVLQNTRNKPLIEKLFNLMKQSIYGVRERLAETKLIRIKYRQDESYNIGIIVSNVYQLLMKSQHQYDHARKLPGHTFFLWHLIIYEKILANSVDVENLVMRAFMYQKSWDEKVSQFAEASGDQQTAGAVSGAPGQGANGPLIAPGSPTPGGFGDKHPGNKGAAPYHPGG